MVERNKAEDAILVDHVSIDSFNLTFRKRGNHCDCIRLNVSNGVFILANELPFVMSFCLLNLILGPWHYSQTLIYFMQKRGATLIISKVFSINVSLTTQSEKNTGWRGAHGGSLLQQNPIERIFCVAHILD